MDVREWLRSRHPAPPVKLAARIEDAVADAAGALPTTHSEALALAGVAILAQLTDPERQESPRREAALDLLAADALVTYALEAAAEDCDALAANADALIARIALLAPARKA